MTFRVTNSIIQRNLLNSIQNRQSEVFLNERRISSGHQFDRPSENALGTLHSIALQRAIDFHDRLQANAQSAKDMNNLADAELGSANDVLQRARELSLRAASEALNEQQIDGVSNEAMTLIERLTDIGNSVEEGKFVFGGFQTDRPPFSIQKNLVIEGTAAGIVVAPLTGAPGNPLGLMNQNNFSTRLESRSMTTALAGSFSLAGGDLLINGIDIGGFNVIDSTRSAEKNAQTLVDLINAKAKSTGVRAVAINLAGGGSFDDPFGTSPAAPPALTDVNTDGIDDNLTGIALATVDANGNITGREIQITGRGFKGATGLDLLRRETVKLGETRLTTERVNAGALNGGAVAGGTITINGVAITAGMAFAAANTEEANAKVIADAINTISDRTEVFARTDGNGFLTLTSQSPFEIAGVPAAPAPVLPQSLNGVHYQSTEGMAASTIPVAAGAVAAGVVRINGLDINFAAGLPGGGSQANADAFVAAVNAASNLTGVTAETQVTNTPAAGDSLVVMKSKHSIEMVPNGGAGAAILGAVNIVAGNYNNASSSAVSTATPLVLSKGSLVINGIDIFNETLRLDATNAPTAVDRANALARAINLKANDTGIKAFASSAGQLYFGNVAKVVTDVVYQGDAGERNTAIGRTDTLKLNMSGDKAFSGNKDITQLMSGVDIPAAGLGSAESTAPVSFNVGDTLVAGEFVINGTSILTGAMAGVPALDAATLVAAVNASSAITGVSAIAFGGGTDQVRLISDTGLPFNLVTTADGNDVNIPGGVGPGSNYVNGVGVGDLLINGIDIGPVTAVPANPGNPAQNILDNANALANAINAKSVLSGVRAEVLAQPTGGTRVLLKAQGQNIEVTSNNSNTSAIFNAIGIRPGTKINQSQTVFESLIKFRNEVLNAKYNRDSVTNISNINVKEIDQALSAVVNNRVELGVRVGRAELVNSRVENSRLLLQEQLTYTRGTDIPKAITDLTADQQTLQAAFSLTPQVLNLSLVNFL